MGRRTVTITNIRSRSNTWIHDRRGRLIGVVDADGRRQSTTYDRWGNPVTVRERDGALTVSAYDERGRLVVRRLPGGARREWEWELMGSRWITDSTPCVTSPLMPYDPSSVIMITSSEQARMREPLST